MVLECLEHPGRVLSNVFVEIILFILLTDGYPKKDYDDWYFIVNLRSYELIILILLYWTWLKFIFHSNNY